MDACVLRLRQDFVHLILYAKFELLKILLFSSVRRGNMRAGLDILYFLFKLRMLPGKRPELLVGCEQMRFHFFVLRVILH